MCVCAQGQGTKGQACLTRNQTGEEKRWPLSLSLFNDRLRQLRPKTRRRNLLRSQIPTLRRRPIPRGSPSRRRRRGRPVGERVRERGRGVRERKEKKKNNNEVQKKKNPEKKFEKKNSRALSLPLHRPDLHLPSRLRSLGKILPHSRRRKRPRRPLLL